MSEIHSKICHKLKVNICIPYFNLDINFSNNLHKYYTYLSKLQLNRGSGRLTSQLDWFSLLGVFHGDSPVSHFLEAESNDKGRRRWQFGRTSGPGMQGRGGHRVRGRNRFQGSKGQPRPPKEWPLPSLTAGNEDLHWHPSKACLVLRPNPRLGPKTIRSTVEAILARPLQVCFSSLIAQ